jgi:hypothetical protein
MYNMRNELVDVQNQNSKFNTNFNTLKNQNSMFNTDFNTLKNQVFNAKYVQNE